MSVMIYIAAYLVDLMLGDPYRWPHPIKVIGNFITFFVGGLRRICSNEKQLKFAGFLLWFVTVGLTYFVTWAILEIAKLNVFIYVGIAIYISYTTLATKCLADEARKIWNTLETGTIDEGRKQLSMIVGRDTNHLTKEQISKATVETVAENSSDGVIAPLFYLFLGGPALAMAYKAVNTLDSMVGYKNEKYKAIGFVSAKMDDLFNYIPARLTWVFIGTASLILKLSWKAAFRIGWRDRKQHSSPNCAFPEGAVAGALGLQLGGSHYYFGQLVEKPYIGDSLREITTNDILQTIKLLYVTSIIALFSFSLIFLFVISNTVSIIK